MKSPSFTCGCGYQQEQLASYCEVVEGRLPENGGKVATGGIDGMWLITQVMNWRFCGRVSFLVCDLYTTLQHPSLEGVKLV